MGEKFYVQENGYLESPALPGNETQAETKVAAQFSIDVLS